MGKNCRRRIVLKSPAQYGHVPRYVPNDALGKFHYVNHKSRDFCLCVIFQEASPHSDNVLVLLRCIGLLTWKSRGFTRCRMYRTFWAQSNRHSKPRKAKASSVECYKIRPRYKDYTIRGSSD